MLETKEQVDKAVAALKAYEEAVHKKGLAEKVCQDRLAALKNATGLVGNDGPKMVEDTYRVIGQAHLRGVTSE